MKGRRARGLFGRIDPGAAYVNVRDDVLDRRILGSSLLAGLLRRWQFVVRFRLNASVERARYRGHVSNEAGCATGMSLGRPNACRRDDRVPAQSIAASGVPIVPAKTASSLCSDAYKFDLPIVSK